MAEITKTRKVLIPVDGSEQAEKGFDWFIENVFHKEDDLEVLHVAELHPPALPHALATEEWKKEVEKHEEKVQALLEKYKKKCQGLQLEGNATVKAVGVTSSVGNKVCEEAKKMNATLVVIGSRGMGLIRRTILGSVSDYVIHHVHCPVVIIPKQ